MTARVVYDRTGLNRQQRRRIEALAGPVDAVLEADRRFFDRHPSRSYRVRRASHVEVEQAQATGNGLGVETGFAWFVAVRQFAPGVRARMFFGGPADNDTDLTDEQARWLYQREVALSPTARAGNANMEALAEVIGGGPA